jgi:enoyl-CoA hydratase
MQLSLARSLSTIQSILNVELRNEGKIAILSFNTPSNLNALTLEMGIKLQEEVAKLSKLDTLRAAIITGTGRAFSAGGDLAFLKERINTSPCKNVVGLFLYNLTTRHA